MKHLLPRHWTIRTRLTVLYGGSFLIAGTVLLAVAYLVLLRSFDLNRDGGSTIRDAGVCIPLDAAERRTDKEILRSLLTGGGIAGLGLVSLAALAGGWLFSGRVLRPVYTITATARRIAAATSAGQHLHERIALSGPRDELRELGDTFDTMLERLDRSFDSQRRFVANASHELRTPLMINRALVESAMTRPDAPPLTRDLGQELLRVNDRHQRLIDGILTLARSEREVTDRTPVDVADLAEYAVDLNEAQAQASGVAVSCTLTPALTSGDPLLLEHLVANIVHNGIRHNLPHGGWLDVSTGRNIETGACLTITNTGPIVPADDVERIFEPFQRLKADRTDTSGGAGLGLSIARAIARAHGGDVTAVPREGGGLIVSITLKTSPPAAKAVSGGPAPPNNESSDGHAARPLTALPQCGPQAECFGERAIF